MFHVVQGMEEPENDYKRLLQLPAVLLCNKASTASLQKLLRSLGTRKHTAILLYSVMQTLCLLQVKMFQRETQTVVTRNQYQQVMEDAATQMV